MGLYAREEVEKDTINASSEYLESDYDVGAGPGKLYRRSYFIDPVTRKLCDYLSVAKIFQAVREAYVSIKLADIYIVFLVLQTTARFMAQNLETHNKYIRS